MAVLGAAVEVARLVYGEFVVGAVGAAGQLHQVAHEVRVELREEGHLFLFLSRDPCGSRVLEWPTDLSLWAACGQPGSLTDRTNHWCRLVTIE